MTTWPLGEALARPEPLWWSCRGGHTLKRIPTDNCGEMWCMFIHRGRIAWSVSERDRGYTAGEKRLESIMDSQAPEAGFREFSDAAIDNNGL